MILAKTVMTLWTSMMPLLVLGQVAVHCTTLWNTGTGLSQLRHPDLEWAFNENKINQWYTCPEDIYQIKIECPFFKTSL